MSEQLLVRPTSLTRRMGMRDHVDSAIVALLRASVAISRFAFRGRGVGFACTLAARMVGKEGRASFQLANGGTFIVSTDDRYWLQPLLLTLSYEPDLDHFLKRTLTSRDVFIDCGANLGLWSIAAAQVIRDPARVVAIEASSRTFSKLAENREANGRSFYALHHALSDVTGDKVSFYASTGDHASATLVQSLSPIDARPEEITTVSLLDLMRDRMPSAAGDSLVFAKIDVEGMEQQVLAPIDPNRHGEIVILYEDHGSSVRTITAFLLERGFLVMFLADDGTLEPILLTNLTRLDELKENPGRGYNLLAIAPKGAAADRLAALYPELRF